MVPAKRTIVALRRARFPNAILEVIPGAGHMLFHEHIKSLLAYLILWLEQVLTPSEPRRDLYEVNCPGRPLTREEGRTYRVYRLI